MTKCALCGFVKVSNTDLSLFQVPTVKHFAEILLKIKQSGIFSLHVICIFKLDLQDTHKLQTWNEALGTILSKNDHVSMKHFAKHFIREFVNYGKIRRTLMVDAIPY